MGRYSLGNLPVPTNIRVVVLGDRSVGKSALVVRYLTKRFIGEYASGAEFTYQKEVSMAGSKVIAEICDAVMKKESQNYLRKLCDNTEACLIVYNVCSRSSFDYACRLARDVKACGIKSPSGGEVPMLLVGNKSDLGHFRKVTQTEGEDFVKSLSACHFVETSAAESYVDVERAFKLIFQLVRAYAYRSLPTSSVNSTRLGRKNSWSQVAQLIRDHYRKQHASTVNHTATDGDAPTNYNEVFVYDRNNNNTTKNTPIKKKMRKNSTLGFSHAPLPHVGKMRSRCVSLTTLNENSTSRVSNAKESVATRRESETLKSTSSEPWKDDERDSPVMKMSISSDDTAESGEFSAHDDDAFLLAETADHVTQDPGTKKTEPSPPLRKTSLNKKNLKICIHSDDDLVERVSSERALVPPKSAPALRSSSVRFRFFPGIGEHQDASHSPQSSITTSNHSGRDFPQSQQSSRSPKEEKKSPSHRFFRQFLKTTLQNSFTNRSYGSGQNLNTSNSTKFETYSGENVKSSLMVIEERKCSEESVEEKVALTKGRSSTGSTSSALSHDCFDLESPDPYSSPPSSPNAPKITKTRRSSLREAVEGLMRKRKPSVTSDAATPNREKFF